MTLLSRSFLARPPLVVERLGERMVAGPFAVGISKIEAVSVTQMISRVEEATGRRVSRRGAVKRLCALWRWYVDDASSLAMLVAALIALLAVVGMTGMPSPRAGLGRVRGWA